MTGNPALTMGFAITPTLYHGWGLVCIHTARRLLARGLMPVMFERPPRAAMMDKDLARRLEPGFVLGDAFKAGLPKDRLCRIPGLALLHALGSDFTAPPLTACIAGERDAAIVAFEETNFDEAALERARRHDVLLAISTFNQRVMIDKGLANVVLAIQGIDPAEMYPGRRKGLFGDRFVVFSGGKLEFRKGQDLVLAAFSIFHARHPDSVLITAWRNFWPASAATMAESALAPVPPGVNAEGQPDVLAWALANGAPAQAIVDLGWLTRESTRAFLWECDAALFPNRCEGGTNNVAQEAMACGVPTIVSANTGHLDLIENDSVFPLERQGKVPGPGREEWGESSVDEMVEMLERLYADRALARRRAAHGLAFIRKRTWRDFSDIVIAATLGNER